MSSNEEDLEESELGTKEFWDKTYKDEIKNYKNHGDVGQIWFGEDIVDRLTSWITKNISEKTSKILDLGCGNGMLSIELFQLDYTNIIGVDYSQDAINLAKEIAESQECSITFKVMDFLHPVPDRDANEMENFDLVLDKGTYDAISLMNNSQINRKLYKENVYKSLKSEESRFLITSCNWTEDELCDQFQSHFELVHVIPTPQFKFGGKVGNVVSSIVLKCKINV